MRIAICDDNITDLSYIISIVNDYKALHVGKHEIDYTAFHSAVDFISALENGQQFEIVLLDLFMPFMTGMDVAKEIRQFNHEIKIIFNSNSPEFAVESYSVGAYYYALKPISKNTVFILLDKIILELKNQKNNSILIKGKNELIRVYFNQLEFVEIIGRTMLYHLLDGSVIEGRRLMSEIEQELLPHGCFIKTHRSYIVNMDHINTLSPKGIKMQSHAVVPLARAKFVDVKNEYITFSFKEWTSNDIT